MGIRVALHHKTVYQYDRPVTLGPQIVRLRPAPHSRTHIVSYSLNVEPAKQFVNWQQDPQSNYLARFVFPEPTRVFSLEVDLVADMAVINPFDFFLEPYAEQIPFEYETWEKRELRPFLETIELGPQLSAYIKTISLEKKQSVNFLVDLNMRLQSEISYLIRLEPGVQTPEETLENRSGSCRDSAWLLVQILRHLGLAARFVSGYLIQLKPDVKSLDGPSGATEDFTDLHAWTEVYLPGAGWIGLDPTSGLFAGEGHIPLAATPDPQTAAPVTGLVSPCEVEFHHEMRVTRIHEDPRVTKPYTDEQWEAILALGDRIDCELLEGDVRLTMGGEPTFVSIDDMDGDEWNTAAMGPNKQRLAGELLCRLRDTFAPGGLIHYGQGKWYPGEQLPRWAYTCYWRTDGRPIWHDKSLIGEPHKDYGFGAEQAQLFAETLARRLAIGTDFIVTAYEDPLTYLTKERDLPINVDPLNNKLDEPEERDRLRRVFQRGLGQPVGFVLPLQRGVGKNGPEWQSGMWMLRSRHLFLMPGDSPVGLRLPLERLPWEPAGEVQKVWTLDPLAPTNPLPIPKRQFEAMQRGPARPQIQKSSDTPASPAAAGPIVRTALAVEAREGRMYVFLPPVASADEYVELVTAVEDTAASLQMPVMLEGYTPPSDSRLRSLKVTPDPGVIEVNTDPSGSWRELVDKTTILYDEARLTRLGTEKFMLDGRHTGTGGGNHLVLGGATPADSPFLRRPDLLRSLVGFWLNHPSLSYLFSGVFIGPTSQAPRVDESRSDAVYELEVAFNLIDPRSPCPPWLTDRLFRNLLVDITGNTHRAEFCIDKLYSPDSSTGRLGLLELRAFEMPPHARMSLAQQLLVRSLVAWFWREPFQAQPVRWGTRLHDRFLLPYYVEKDFTWVVDALQRAGYPMDPAWFGPHIEFRFPVYGRVVYDGVEIELRQAIEPWYVLGEEPGGGGTTRFVDSSVERMQVRVRGLTGERRVVTCNGRRLPLQPTGVHGEYVCGVRFRAWQPPRCLHPTIPVHAPLVFDLLDLAAGRSIGGCTYYAGHPGGRNYETFAVNSNEAEARRMARFLPFGHTPGPMPIPPVEENPEFPSTLDLRTAHRRRHGQADDAWGRLVKKSKLVPGRSRWEEFRYAPIPGHWDEALQDSGLPRRHWRGLAVALGRMGFRQFSRSWHIGQQLIQSNGVTYNVGGDPAGKDRPWPMDPIPLVIPTEEWDAIDKAVRQRAELLNVMLRDLYGEQRLVRERRLPAALVYANPHFQRSCFGLTPVGNVPLQTYAVDLARSPDGRWWALGDRTQAPSGIGYALENRLVSARILPSVFNQCRVRALTRFFDAKRNALLSLAPSRRETPRVVLLTPGPHNETYFEHSFLAGHWGFPLVEGGDLTVRDSRVFLKTLSGLEPVDVILRRMDDGFCDPLELRGDSLLGVPGLMQAVRNGTVAVDNAIGSGVLETPGLMAFLPGLCRDLLGEELLLPSVATWWCGQAAPRRYVLEHMDELVIKPAFRKYGLHPEFPARMSAAARAQLIRRIEAQPELFVGQELVNMSTVPVRTDEGLGARHAGLRVFAARDGEGYTVMPGGLTRVAGETSPVVSMQLGAGSKDTWVFEGEAEPPPPPRPMLTVRPSRTSLPSRVADNLYWLGRYAERVDSGVRLVRSLLPALSGEEDFGRAASLETVVQLMSGLRFLPDTVPEMPLGQQRWHLQKLLSDLVYDSTRMSGIGWNLKQMRRSAWNLKERLSSDTWRVVQQLEADISRTPPGNPDQRLTAQITLLDGVIVTMAAFSGLVMENMTRAHGFRFLDIGRRLERSLQMGDLLRAGIVSPPGGDDGALQLLLHIADSSITYRSRNLTMLRADLVLDLLLCDETNPRSVGMQLAALRDHVDELPEHAEIGRQSREQRLALKTLTAVRLADVELLTRRDKDGALEPLGDLLAGLKTDMFDLSEALTAQYLSHLQTARLRSSD